MKENNKLPDIIIDDYQEIKHINKIQPRGWNKQGIWIGFNNIKLKKKVKQINKTIVKSTIEDKFEDIILLELDGVAHIYSTNNNYFNIN